MAKFKTTTREQLFEVIIDNALKHVVFDGWSDQTLKNVCKDLKISTQKAWQIFPRGGVDLALAFHRRDDEKFLEGFRNLKVKQSDWRIRDRIEAAINYRLDVAAKNKEAVKRSIALLTTPFYFAEGSGALWSTSDKIWISIGDKSEDINWYSKRLILSSVYSASLIFWIEDASENFKDTKDFVNRRIRDVMAVERLKGVLKESSVLKGLFGKFGNGSFNFVKHKENFPGWSY